MNTKRKSRSAGGTAGAGQAETAAFGGAAIPCNHFTTGGAGSQSGFIAGLLLYGPENGQTITDLERLTGWRSREIRKQIEQERRQSGGSYQIPRKRLRRGAALCWTS